MFDPNFIEIYDNALPSYYCKEIIQWMEKQELGRGILGPEKRFRIEEKDCWEIGSNLTKVGKGENPLSTEIFKCLGDHIQSYKNTYPSLQSIGYWQVSEGYNSQKYNPGQGYHQIHCEHDHKNSIRVMAWMIYLNTVTDKGGTYFNVYDKMIRPKEGRLVIWPAYWTHTHHGIVSETETKYLLTGWYEFCPLNFSD